MRNFYGGVHPPTCKDTASDKATRQTFIPKRVVIPLLQHTGVPAEPKVAPGDIVKVGSLIGSPSGFISSAAHASISGKVTRVSHAPTPTLARSLCVTIESQDNEIQELKTDERPNAASLSRAELLDIIGGAGIVGLGGAAFPTRVKLSPPKGKAVDTLILNGAECEPYLTCDYRVMIERPGDILKGLEVIAKILEIRDIYVAIENNKPRAVETMEKALSAVGHRLSAVSAKVVILKTKYPQGAEKQIIKAVLNRVVPAGGLPMDVGCVVQNAQTAFAVYEAVYFGKPLIERVVTVGGSCVKEPINARVRIGTLISDLVGSLGPFIKEPKKVIVGGPMMGLAQYTLDIPIVKGTSGILFFSQNELRDDTEGVCIRCARCVEVCPMGLAPTSLMHRVKKENFKEARAMGIDYCYECGSCAYICPAKIPLVDYMKFGKAKKTQ
ncbi:MAG: electron transport complex subunit RsxC [Candidatus Omnitrophica bacterium]|nr:electron transport complex subunit RsxC [Candidatus Omnitrophota bacterium]